MKSRGIVLHILKFKDDQLIADVLTEERGLVGMAVRVSRSRRAAVRHVLFQPLAVLDLEWDERQRASLQRPRAAQVAVPLATLPCDPFKSAMGLFVAEFLLHAVRGESEPHALFAYVVRSLEWLDACGRDFSNFHLVFLLRLSRFLGFMPNVEDYRPGSYFDLRAAVFTRVRPLHPDFLAPEDAALLPKLLRMRYATMHVFRFTGRERSRLLEQMNRYYSLHIPNFPELKSLDVLRTLFAS